jgi:peptide methionine sulfoxide reductase MsrA
VIEIVPLEKFYPGEEYRQDYFIRTRARPLPDHHRAQGGEIPEGVP